MTILPGRLPGARSRARQISVTVGDRHRLTKLASSRTAGYQQVVRARIVLAAERGASNNAISRRLGVSVDTVRCWRGRYADHGLAGLTDRPRSGRPPRLSPLQVGEVKALACQLPAETGVPLSRWSCPELADEELHGGGSWLDFRDEGGEYRGLTDEQMALINPIVRNAVADMLHALDHPELAAARRLLRFTQMLVPPYWEEPELTESYSEMLASVKDDVVPCRHCGRSVFQVGDRWYHRDAQGNGVRGCYAASFVADKGWDTELNRNWKATPGR